jgi:hypothetical protein
MYERLVCCMQRQAKRRGRHAASQPACFPAQRAPPASKEGADALPPCPSWLRGRGCSVAGTLGRSALATRSRACGRRAAAIGRGGAARHVILAARPYRQSNRARKHQSQPILS